MENKPTQQRKRNVILASVLLAITLIASAASILPFVGVTSVGQLGAAITNVIAAYSQRLVWLVSYIGIIGFSLLVALLVVYLVRVLLLTRRKTERSWRLFEAALALPLVVALLIPFYVPKPTIPALPDAQQVWREGLLLKPNDVSLDPSTTSSADVVYVDQLIFPGLVRLDKDSRVQNWAAQSNQLGQDGASYTFTLRPNLAWSDGTPIRAEDFAYSINRTLDPCTASPSAPFLLTIKNASAFHGQPCKDGKADGSIATLIGLSLRVTDPLTLTIQLEGPTPSFLAQLTAPASWAVPRALVEKYGADWANHLANGGGFGGDLFKVTSLDFGHKIVLERNPGFWGKHPVLRRIEFTFYSGADVDSARGAMYTAYLAGQREAVTLDNAAIPSAKLRPDYQTSKTLILQYLHVNWATPPFDDLRMRQAFALALNKERLAQDQTFCGACVATNHLVPSGMPGYDATISGPDGGPSLQGNAIKAKALGQNYANDKCAGELSKCPPVTLWYIDNFETTMQEAKSMWADALPGYPITLHSLTAKDYFGDFEDPSWQIYWAPWVADYPDPQDFLSLFFLPDAAYNPGKVDVPAATTLMRQGDVELNASKRVSEYHQAEQLLVTNVASIPLVEQQGAYLLSANVVNYRPALVGVASETWQQIYLGKV
jgi:peptide/nickel transport system substrate-binding protein/oligopeptide transport system substrate-binding protein